MAWWIFQNVGVTAVLAAVVALICRTTRLGPVARHALWVLVLVKFVTPPLVSWPWTAPDPFGVSALDARSDASPVAVARTRRRASARTDASTSAAIAAGAGRGHRGRCAADGSPTGRPRHGAGSSTLWAAGSVLLIVIEGARLVRLARQVRARVRADAALVHRVATLSSPARTPSRPGARRRAASPHRWCGVWAGRGCCGRRGSSPMRPTRVSTGCSCTNSRTSSGAITSSAGSSSWPASCGGGIPLFWFVRSSLREHAELACDAWVISALPNGRRAYAESLLALSSAASWTVALDGGRRRPRHQSSSARKETRHDHERPCAASSTWGRAAVSGRAGRGVVARVGRVGTAAAGAARSGGRPK